MLRSLDNVAADLRIRLRDIGKDRWTDDEVMSSIQTAVGFWHMRVGFYFNDRTVVNPITQLDDGFTFQTVPIGDEIKIVAEVSVDSDATWEVSGITDGSSGHIKFGTEYIRFADASDGVLLGVERINTPVVHLVDEVGTWYIYYDHPALMDTLARNATEMMSLMYNADGSPKSISHHQWSARFADLRSDSWWRQYVPHRDPLGYTATDFTQQVYGEA